MSDAIANIELPDNYSFLGDTIEAKRH